MSSSKTPDSQSNEWPHSFDAISSQSFFDAEIAPFIAHNINPEANERDIRDIPLEKAVFQKAGEMGLLAWLAPTSAGGLGGSAASFARLLARSGYVCDEPAFPSLLSMYADIARMIATCNSPEVVERYAKSALRGDLLFTFAYTEQGDSHSFKTIAEESKEGWVISGHKVAQTGGAVADGFLLYAKGPSGHIKVFLLDRNLPGVTVTPRPTVGFRAAGITSLTLDEVTVPRSHELISLDGSGHVQKFLGARRIYACAAWPGFMRRLLSIMVGYLRTRIRSGRPLAHNETMQAHIGDLVIQCQIAEAVLEDALVHMAKQAEDGPVFDSKLTATKYILGESGLEFVQKSMRMLGWPGFTMDMPFQRFLRDFQGVLSGQTPQEVIKALVGNDEVARFELLQHRRRRVSRASPKKDE